MVRQALATLLGLEGDMEVVVEVAAGAEVAAAVDAYHPDVALLDIEMPGGDGLQAAAALHDAHPEVKILILTTFGRPGFLRRAMESGASGFLLKDAPAADLAAAIRKVLAGQRVVDPALAAAALAEGANPLTAREMEVLGSARDVATIADMAGVLHLSQGTVRNHLSVIIQKLGARNRVDAVRIALEKGWLPPR
ncbi:response regulator transcription factor [Acidiferrimicrobium sp. IK]|nr:response regulator transcription factor [Acidiferrimicrobium sp. IK]